MISISQYHPLVRISTGLSVRTVPFHQISIANGTTLFTLDGSGVSEYFVMALLEVMGFLRAQRDVWIMNERRPPGASAIRVQGPARQRSAAGEAGFDGASAAHGRIRILKRGGPPYRRFHDRETHGGGSGAGGRWATVRGVKGARRCSDERHGRSLRHTIPVSRADAAWRVAAVPGMDS